MKSLRAQQLVQADQADAHLRGAAGCDVGVVGDDVHAEGGQPLRDQHADPAEADDADGLLVELDAGVLAALPLALPAAPRWPAAMLRAAASSSPTASSAALTMLDCGALTTMTPAWVAALTSTLSRPTPARATTLSRRAAASASASTLVALRTRIASTSAMAGSSAARSAPSHVPDLEVRPERVDGRRATAPRRSRTTGLRHGVLTGCRSRGRSLVGGVRRVERRATTGAGVSRTPASELTPCRAASD